MATGAVQYAFGGAGYNIPIGIVTGGEWGDDTNSKVVAGIGGVGVHIPGAQTTTASVELVPVNNASLLDKILRTNVGDMPPLFPLAVGDDDDARKSAEWYVNTAEITLAAEEALAVSYDLMMFGKPTGTAVSGTFSPALTPLLWLEGYVTVDGADAEAQSCKLSINNDLLARFSLNQKSDGSRRHPDGSDSGAEKIEATLELFDPTGDDLLADDFATGSIIVVAKNQAATATTATFTGNSGKLISAKSSLVDGDSRRMWTVTYRWDYNAAFSIAYS